MNPNTRAEVHIASLATFVHGVLTGLHLLGVVYNLRRRNWSDVAAHSAAAMYDLHATARHAREQSRLLETICVKTS